MPNPPATNAMSDTDAASLRIVSDLLLSPMCGTLVGPIGEMG
jgi:hypothetical protein